MKILQLCSKPPYPSVDGGTMAMHSITQGLLDQGCEVWVLSVETDKHPVKELPEEYREKTHFQSVYIDLSVRPINAGVALLCGESYNVQRFESKAFAAKLTSLLKKEQFDVVHLESLFLAPYVPTIRKYSQAKVVLRAHNVEHQIWQRQARQLPLGMRRWYFKKLALALRMYELEHVNDFDAVVCITQADADYFKVNGCKRRPVVLPFGIESDNTPQTSVVEPTSLYHLGSMDWMPNIESLDWFLDKVWPLLHKELPQVKLYLAGRKMPDVLLNLNEEGVIVAGEVEDAQAFISSKQINIVPLRSGSGIRVKIIEAMAAGKVVVSTTIGAQGIDCRDSKDILIADTPEAFVEKIRYCVENPEAAQEIGSNAQALARERYDSKKLAQRLVDYYIRLCEKEESC